MRFQGQDLDGLGSRAIGGDLAMIVPIGAHQIRQEFGVPNIRFGPRYMVAVAVAGGRQWVDRTHLITRSNERLDPQATVGFNTDHNVARFLGVLGHKLMELADPGKSLG